MSTRSAANYPTVGPTGSPHNHIMLPQDVHALGAPEEQRLFLHATACEIYNDAVYDLLGEEKVQCTLRTDETGALRVLGPAVIDWARDFVGRIAFPRVASRSRTFEILKYEPRVDNCSAAIMHAPLNTAC